MADTFAEDDAKTWSPEFRAAYEKVWFGLIDGDLTPLEAYLESDFPMTRSLRQAIADCILGEDTLHRIMCVKRRPGPGGIREAAAHDARITAISRFVEERLPEGSRGHLPKALHAAAIEFGLSEHAIRKARAEYRRRIKAGIPIGYFQMTGWADLRSPERLAKMAKRYAHRYPKSGE